MPEWIKDFWIFLLSIKRHLVFLVTSSIFAAAGAVYEHTVRPIPAEIIWGAIIIFIVIASFLAWRDQYRQVLTRQERRRIREGIARFQQIGTTLQVDCETTMPNTISDQTIYDRFAQYDQEAQAWLTTNLDRFYATRFSDPTGLNMQAPLVNTTTRTRVWGFVANRQARLREFIMEYLDQLNSAH